MGQTTSSGDLDIGAVKTVMDMFEIEDQADVMEKVFICFRTAKKITEDKNKKK